VTERKREREREKEEAKWDDERAKVWETRLEVCVFEREREKEIDRERRGQVGR